MAILLGLTAALASAGSTTSDDAAFVQTLQKAIRTDNRAAVTRMLRYPLRVNHGGRTWNYPTPRAAAANFDRIFTPAVRAAILAQPPGAVFRNSRGAMIGSGDLWFDATCLDKACRHLGPVRVFAVNR